MSSHTMVVTDGVHVRIRFAWAVAVAVITFLAWQLVWAVGASILGLDAILGTPLPRTFNAAVALFGAIWLWFLAGVTVFLVLAALARPRYVRPLALAWFLALVFLYGVSLITFGGFELFWAAILVIVSAAGLLTWIRHLTKRAA